MARFVIDASAALAWLFGEAEMAARLPSDFTQAAFVAPLLLRTDVCYAILRRERQHQIGISQANRLMQIVDAMPIEYVAESCDRSLLELAIFARPHQLSSYDALYLELAVHRGLPLCTMDRNLQLAARRVGVELVVDLLEPPRKE